MKSAVLDINIILRHTLREAPHFVHTCEVLLDTQETNKQKYGLN
jgi:hypothetical protein